MSLTAANLDASLAVLTEASYRRVEDGNPDVWEIVK